MTKREDDLRIDYVEFSVANIDASKKFYGSAFGWRFTDYGPNYCEFDDGRLKGGFTNLEAPRPGGPLVILYAHDLEAAFDAIWRPPLSFQRSGRLRARSLDESLISKYTRCFAHILENDQCTDDASRGIAQRRHAAALRGTVFALGIDVVGVRARKAGIQLRLGNLAETLFSNEFRHMTSDHLHWLPAEMDRVCRVGIEVSVVLRKHCDTIRKSLQNRGLEEISIVRVRNISGGRADRFKIQLWHLPARRG
jgi:catechol 2,3-dioxygenase-like lactoylglutathione lyase family enzyme